MSSVTIVLLCEDKQTESFVCNFLKHRNFKKGRDITTLVASSGSGEQWVRKQYPKQLNAIRNKKNAYLIVVIDADMYTIDDRHEQLKKECKDKDILPRDIKRDVNVLHIIPCRNIETWLAYLENESVDESKVYPKLKRESDCKEHTRRLHDMCRAQRLREPAPPSLQEACNEYPKLQR